MAQYSCTVPKGGAIETGMRRFLLVLPSGRQSRVLLFGKRLHITLHNSGDVKVALAEIIPIVHFSVVEKVVGKTRSTACLTQISCASANTRKVVFRG